MADNSPIFRSRSRVNGATQTFRRPSLATTPSQTQLQTRDSTSTSNVNNGGVYIPPHLNVNNPSASARSLPPGETRYTKDQLLNIFQTLKESSVLDRNLEDIFLGTWDPLEPKNESSHQVARGDGKDQTPGPEVCWNYDVELEPFGLTSMTEDEKQVRRGTVLYNSWTWLIIYGSSFLLLSIPQSNYNKTPPRRIQGWV